MLFRSPLLFPLSGAVFAEAAVADFAKFFSVSTPLSVELRVSGISPRSGRDSSGQHYIAIDSLMADHEIVCVRDMFYHLLIIGHELAHVLYRHVGSKADGPEDHRSLEYWADFAGTKIALTLFTYGGKISSLSSRATQFSRFEIGLRSLGAALGMLVDSVYSRSSNSSKYPPTIDRISMVVAGALSFFRQEFMGDNIDPIWHFSVIRRVSSSKSIKDVYILEKMNSQRVEANLERARTWHKRIQGEKMAISAGVLPDLQKFLGSDFSASDEIIELRKKLHTEELQAAGLL